MVSCYNRRSPIRGFLDGFGLEEDMAALVGCFRVTVFGWLGFVTRWGEEMTGLADVAFEGVVEEEAPDFVGDGIRCW